jgi:DNA-binding transcriptional MocR family regulator
MRLRSPWQPRLVKGELPPSDRLIAALSDDILTGRLEAGMRLPPHRDLAYRLEIGLGTVTKASMAAARSSRRSRHAAVRSSISVSTPRLRC